jgi:hypothetical protein
MASGNGRIVADARVDKLVADYIATRNYIKALKDKHKAELAEFELALEKLGGRLLLFLDSHGQEMARTAAGTVSATVRDTASLSDPDIFIEFVAEHGLYELLDRRANATACKDFAKENGTLPPGVRINTLRGVSVRTATAERIES